MKVESEFPITVCEINKQNDGESFRPSLYLQPSSHLFKKNIALRSRSIRTEDWCLIYPTIRHSQGAASEFSRSNDTTKKKQHFRILHQLNDYQDWATETTKRFNFGIAGIGWCFSFLINKR